MLLHWPAVAVAHEFGRDCITDSGCNSFFIIVKFGFTVLFAGSDEKKEALDEDSSEQHSELYLLQAQKLYVPA